MSPQTVLHAAHEDSASSDPYLPPETSLGSRVWMYDPWCRTPWYTAALTRVLLSDGVDVRLVCPRYHLEPDYFRSEGLLTQPGLFDFSTCGALTTMRLRQPVRLAEYLLNTALLSIESAFRPPDILHQQQCALLEHERGMELDFLRWCQRRGARIVHTVHNVLPHESATFHLSLYARLYRLADALICHSEKTAADVAQLFSIDPRRIYVVPHGPLFAEASVHSQQECRALLGIDPSRKVFLAHGVIRPYKGIDLLLSAWARLTARWSGSRPPLLVIAGHGSEIEVRALKEQAGRLRLTENEVQLDLRYSTASEVPLYFNAADVLVYPYRDITTSGALLTGLNFCKPIIASDLLPFRPYLKSGQNALLVPPGDIEALSQAVFSLSTHGGLCRKLQDGSRANHSLQTQWSEIGMRTKDVYRAVLTPTIPSK
jgi:glycosyltransferase involved in cell wall biosynthesis